MRDKLILQRLLRQGACSIFFFVICLIYFPDTQLFAQDAQAKTLIIEPDYLSVNSNIRGLIKPSREATISSRIADTIIEIQPQPGERFEKNQILVKFDCSFFRAQRRKAVAELTASKKKSAVNQELDSYGSGSILDIELAKADVIKASAEVAIIDSRIKECAIRAPFSGLVVQHFVNNFESVSIGDDLIQILDQSSLHVVVLFPSYNLKDIAVGSQFTIVLDELKQRLSGSVERFGGQIDSSSQTIEVFGKLKEIPAGLISGMSGDVLFGQQQ